MSFIPDACAAVLGREDTSCIFLYLIFSSLRAIEQGTRKLQDVEITMWSFESVSKSIRRIFKDYHHGCHNLPGEYDMCQNQYDGLKNMYFVAPSINQQSVDK